MRFLPITINIATVLVGIGLFAYGTNNPDLGFQYHFKDYSDAVNLIETGQLQISEDGFVRLPDELTGVSITGDAYVIRRGHLTTIYFMYDRESFDGYSWGYLYRSDGSEPSISKDDRNPDCSQTRPIIPSTPKWFYCESHRIFWSSNESNR